MKEIENIQELAEKLGDRGFMNPNEEYETVGEVVDALINLGNTDEVYAFHDDHNGLLISDELKNTPLENLDESEFESEVEEILEQADTIIALSEKNLTEDDIDDIKEDMTTKGQNPEELDI